MPAKKLRVELLVCPEPSCRQIGKLPGSALGVKGYCTGPLGSTHGKRRMELVAFVQEKAA